LYLVCSSYRTVTETPHWWRRNGGSRQSTSAAHETFPYVVVPRDTKSFRSSSTGMRVGKHWSTYTASALR